MTAPSWVRRRFVVAWCAIALGLAGCTAEEPVDPGPPSTVEHPAPEVPKDRDERSVIAALAKIDLCAVLGPAVASTPEAPARTPEARSPSQCRVAYPDGRGVELRIEGLSTANRLKLPSQTLGGAKAYLSDYDNACTVSLPVSFELAVAVDVDVLGVPATDPCVVAETTATAVATTLADPATARADARWEACAVLGSAPGTDVERPSTVDRCGTTNGLVVFEFRYGQPSNDPSDGWLRTLVGDVEIWTRYDPDPEFPSCTIEWSQGPAPSPYAVDYAKEGAQLVASLRAVDCARVTPLVEPLITTLREPPAEVEPQRPLLYGPDEPDSPRPGACAYTEETPCAPYVEKSVPAEVAEILRAAEADLNLHCAVALDAVVEHFGAQVRPVTLSSDCRFVEPERLAEVKFNVSSATVRDLGGGQPRAERIEIAGHPGYIADSQDGNGDYDVWVAISTEADRPGTLHLALDEGPVAVTEPGPLPTMITAKAELVLADILRAHFSR